MNINFDPEDDDDYYMLDPEYDDEYYDIDDEYPFQEEDNSFMFIIKNVTTRK